MLRKIRYLNVCNFPVEKIKEIYNTPDEKSAVKLVCRQILESLNLRKSPIPLKPICDKFNLKINYDRAIKREDSFLKLSPTGFEIDISRDKNWRRNRFTIAHELVHILLYNILDTPVNSFDETQYCKIENLCDIGASELLINENEIVTYLRERGLNAETLLFLYDKFLVSYNALFLKLSEILGTNIIVWKKYARNTSEKNELRVYRHFPSYKYAEKSTWLPYGCTTKHIDPNIFEKIDMAKHPITNKLVVSINKNNTYCFSISFFLPNIRKNKTTLPMFESVTVEDEFVYKNCYIMFVFRNEDKFNNALKYYVKNEQK